MTRFVECLSYVLQHEGGYSNHRADRGGATNRGITQATYDEWRVGNGLSRNPVVGISQFEIEAIYAGRYWRPVRADDLPVPLDLVVFDAAVQHGAGRAAKWLQRVVGAIPDGRIGPRTLDAMRSTVAHGSLARVVHDFLDIREDFYGEIVANDPSQAVFSRGWSRRMAAIRAAVKEVLGCG